MSSFKAAVPYLLVILVGIKDVFCGDASVSFVKPETSASPTNQKVPNVPFAQPSWINANQSTTPWPALGARPQKDRTNKPRDWVAPQRGPSPISNDQLATTSRNVGVDLSYGLNQPINPKSPSTSNRNVDNILASNTRNVGVDLSYGLDPNRNVKTQNVPIGGNVQAGPTMGQVTTPKSVTNTKANLPSYSSVLRQNQNQKPVAGSQVGNAQKINPVPGMNSQNQVSSNTTSTDGIDQAKSNVSEDDELREFSEVLLRKDVNNVAKFVTINYQGKTTSRSKNDEAPLPLLMVKPEAFSVPTIAKVLLLHNNYILETNANEHVTPQEKAEENSLLDAVLSTQVMQHTRNFLVRKGKLAKDPKDFRDKLKEIWFNMYSRGSGKIGSSGFEHVFLAEIKNNEITGSHNWLYFNDAEIKKQVNYLGYLKKVEFGNKGAIIKHHFSLAGKDKPVGSMFIGTSPELEMALYTTCYLMRPDGICPLKLGGNKFIVRTYTFRYRGKNMIGSAFPEI